MYVSIPKPKKNSNLGNKGSCTRLADYLCKEVKNDVNIESSFDVSNENSLVKLQIERAEYKELIADLESQLAGFEDSETDSFYYTEALKGHYQNTLSDIENNINEIGEDQKFEVQLSTEIDSKNFFFDHNNDFIGRNSAIDLIDKNSVGLERDDSKFFMVVINPSQNEMNHLLQDIVSDKEIKSIDDLNPQQLEAYYNKLQKYTHSVMDIYADEMNRTKKNGERITGKDLVYFGKIENTRKYNFADKEVKHNKKISIEISNTQKNTNLSDSQKLDQIQNLQSKYIKTEKGENIKDGTLKTGLQTHIHVVVSRYDKDKKIKMSPLSNSKGKADHKVGQNECQIGFSRTDFAIRSQDKFDDMFNYQRQAKEHTAVKIENRRSTNKSLIQGANNILKKDGRIDVLEAYKFQIDLIKSMRNLNSVQGSQNLQSISKALTNTINPTQVLRNQMYQVNPVAQAKQTIKNVITKGGLEL